MKKEFIVNRQGKDFALYAGLLDQAHQEGLKRISTTLIQAPMPENGQMAICHAEVETEKGVFSGIGDANPDNVGRMIAMHTIRMAETRAKARALRDAINVGVTAFEELGDVEDPDGAAAKQAPARRYDQRPQRQGFTPPDQHGEMRRTAPAAPVANGVANAQQIDRIHKLQAALGQPSLVNANLSAEDAARQITELVRAFNARAKDAKPTDTAAVATPPVAMATKEQIAHLKAKAMGTSLEGTILARQEFSLEGYTVAMQRVEKELAAIESQDDPAPPIGERSPAPPAVTTPPAARKGPPPRAAEEQLVRIEQLMGQTGAKGDPRKMNMSGAQAQKYIADLEAMVGKVSAAQTAGTVRDAALDQLEATADVPF